MKKYKSNPKYYFLNRKTLLYKWVNTYSRKSKHETKSDSCNRPLSLKKQTSARLAVGTLIRNKNNHSKPKILNNLLRSWKVQDAKFKLIVF